jgi:hypothetical protein
MKNKLICLSLLVSSAALSCRAAEALETSINPALQYYQAFLLTPDLPKADADYLLMNNWQGQQLSERVGKLLSEYDNQFKVVCQAARSTAPCDWGIDRSNGPTTLLPHLARAKAVATAARLRVMWHLQHGRQEDAREELLAVFALARNVSSDGTLIGLLVQIASEAINCTTLAANFGRFAPETLEQLAIALEARPHRRTLAECMITERAFSLDWTERKIRELQRQSPGDDAKVMEGIHQLFEPLQETPDLWQRIVQAAGGTSEGMLRLLQEREQVYNRTAQFVTLPYAEYTRQVKAFSEEVANSPNPFVSETIPKFIKAREREFRILATLELVRAGIAYRLHREEGLKGVTDPCGEGPFAFRRFLFEGVDRGFELKSAFDLGGNQSVLIFVEKEGPPFQVDGNYPGRPLSTAAPQR